MSDILANARYAYSNPISSSFAAKPYKAIPLPVTQEVQDSLVKEGKERFDSLNTMVNSLGLRPTQTMAKRIRAKKLSNVKFNQTKDRAGNILKTEMVGNSDRYVIRKDKKTGKEVIVDRHSLENENVELIGSYLVSYCQRKLLKMRSGKGRGKGIDFDSGNMEPVVRKDGKRVLRKFKSGYLKGSQDHIRSDSRCIADALDATQNALLFWIEANIRSYLSKLSESDMVKYIRDSKRIGKPALPSVETYLVKPLSYRILAIGCFQVMRESRRYYRKVDSKVWDNRHGIKRIGDEPVKELPTIVQIPLQEVRESLDQLPTGSRTEKNTKRILLMRLNGISCKDIAAQLGFPFAYVRKAVSRFRKANPYLCHSVLTPV